MARQVTLKDIAREANLSIAAVSKALNNYEHVSAATRQKVIAISKRMNYRPRRRIARSDADAQTNGKPPVIGLLLLGLDPSQQYTQRRLMSLTRAANERGARLQLSGITIEDLRSGMPLDSHIDGLDSLMVVGDVTRALVDAVRQLGLPSVVLGQVLGRSNSVEGCGWVVATDTIRMAQAGTQKLIDAGHRRIAFMSRAKPPDSWNDLWLVGYSAAMRHAGLNVDNRLCRLVPNLDSNAERMRIGLAIVREMMELDEPPTAFVTPTANGGIRVMRRLELLGRTIPAQCFVVGTDGSEVTDPLDESFPCVLEDVDVICRTAMRIICSHSLEILPEDVLISVPFNSERLTVAPPSHVLQANS